MSSDSDSDLFLTQPENQQHQPTDNENENIIIENEKRTITNSENKSKNNKNNNNNNNNDDIFEKEEDDVEPIYISDIEENKTQDDDDDDFDDELDNNNNNDNNDNNDKNIYSDGKKYSNSSQREEYNNQKEEQQEEQEEIVPLLDFHKQILTEVLTETNVLAVSGKGLGLYERVVNYLIHDVFSDPHQLVLIINATPEQEAVFQSMNIHRPRNSKAPKLRSISSDSMGVNERKDLYLHGGCLCVTSRILVVDLLTQRVPVSLVTGIIVCNAHTIEETSTETFILRLFRQSNREAFVKGFTDACDRLTRGFAQVEKVMKRLLVTELTVWPRFHEAVCNNLEQSNVDVEEFEIPLTKNMKIVQDAIVDVIKDCLSDLKSSNENIDLTDFSVEDSLFKSFDWMMQRQLDPVWTSVGLNTKSLVEDLSTLRTLLSYLTRYDCVSFYEYIENLRDTSAMLASSLNTNVVTNSWLFMNQALELFQRAKDRVYIVKEHFESTSPKKRRKTKAKQKKRKNEDSLDSIDSLDDIEEHVDQSIQLVLEENPKWNLLKEIIEEIRTKQNNNNNNNSEENNQDKANDILVFVREERTAFQLSEYLSIGREMLHHRFHTYVERKSKQRSDHVNRLKEAAEQLKTAESRRRKHGFRSGTSYQRGRRQRRGGGSASSSGGRRGGRGRKKSNVSGQKRRSSSFGKSSDSSSSISREKELEMAQKQLNKESPSKKEKDNESETTCKILEDPIIIHPIRNAIEIIKHVQPRHIILYDVDISLIREIEVYAAEHPYLPLKVYFFMYDESVEKQKYLTTLRQERSAFERLIRTKATLALPAFSEMCRSIERPSVDPALADRISVPRVVVDMREFRSSLPVILHGNPFSIDVEPATLHVGDYIISPEICIERKSVPDLFGSFASGRLFSQAAQMVRFYPRYPILLIEFDADKEFGLESSAERSPSVSTKSISSKIVILTLHYPQLRILWCRTPHVAAEMIKTLKAGRSEEPDATQAAAVGSNATDYNNNDDDTEDDELGNTSAQDMLKRMPGVTSRNAHRIMENVTNLSELCRLPLSRLKELIGTQNGQQLYRFLRASPMFD